MTLAADRWMGRLIRFGGVGVVLAVFGMLAFLIFQVFPLFTGAKVTTVTSLTAPASAVAFGEDEYGEFPYVVLADGKIVSSARPTARRSTSGLPRWVDCGSARIRSYPRAGLVFLGLSDGTVQELRVAYRFDLRRRGQARDRARRHGAPAGGDRPGRRALSGSLERQRPSGTADARPPGSRR
jgi:phosphate transport system permease protein